MSRPGGLTSMGDAVRRYLAAFADLTDEEWDARDAAARRAEAERAEAERVEALDRRSRALVAAGASALAVRMVLLEPDRLVRTAALDAVRGNDGLLVLSGDRGTGKTLAAVSWLTRPVGRKLVQYGEPRMVDAAKLEALSRYDGDELGALRTAGRLVIDDLGLDLADGAGAFATKLDGLVNARYANELPTLITTNMLAGDFRARYGERIMDRIRETGRWVSLPGPSMRKGGAR